MTVLFSGKETSILSLCKDSTDSGVNVASQLSSFINHRYNLDAIRGVSLAAEPPPVFGKILTAVKIVDS